MKDWKDYYLKALKLEGQVAEIGLGIGENTRYLLEHAIKYHKNVAGVDPFEEGWNDMPESYGKPYRYDKFIETIGNYGTYLVLCKENSLTDRAEKFLSGPLCFAYVDGLQYKGAVLSDLRIVSHAEIICVDDYNRLSGISEVPLAIEEYLKTSKKKLIDLGRWAILIK